MDGRHCLVRGDGNDRAAAEGPSFGVEPQVPESSEYERVVVCIVKVEGLL